MRGSASACIRVRFQRHNVLPYAFCFNFLEATGSISFASPSSLFFFSSLFPSSYVPLSSVTASATARRPSWELREMYHGGFQHCGCCYVYISSSSLSYPSPFSPRLLFSILPRRSHTTPPRPVSSLSFPSHSIYPFLATRSLMPLPLHHGVKG